MAKVWERYKSRLIVCNQCKSTVNRQNATSIVVGIEGGGEEGTYADACLWVRGIEIANLGDQEFCSVECLTD